MLCPHDDDWEGDGCASGDAEAPLVADEDAAELPSAVALEQQQRRFGPLPRELLELDPEKRHVEPSDLRLPTMQRSILRFAQVFFFSPQMTPPTLSHPNPNPNPITPPPTPPITPTPTPTPPPTP